MLNSWMGFGPLITYTIEILEEAGSTIDPNIGLIAVGAIRLVFAGKRNMACY